MQTETKTTKRTRANGYILHETGDLVVIATGFTRKSSNPKTGDMIQIWILVRRQNPVRALKTGADWIVCGNCKHRGRRGKGRTCYVRVANAPLGVWKAYRRGRYPYLNGSAIEQMFSDRRVRFGAYGDPVHIPFAITRAIALSAERWTGYTHQWQNPAYAGYRSFLMASCDTVSEYAQAKTDGWRTFRVRSANETLYGSEIACPASEEMGHRTTCAKCGLCNGAKQSDARKDIAIFAHGAGKTQFQLIQIGKAA